MDGDYLFYNPETATTLHFNQPSMLIWNLCDGQNTVGDIIDQLVEAFPEQAEQIESDVLSTVDDLVGQKVLLRAED